MEYVPPPAPLVSRPIMTDKPPTGLDQVNTQLTPVKSLEDCPS